MVTHLQELAEKIQEAEKLLDASPNIRRIEVEDSEGTKAIVVSTFVHVNGN